MPGALKGVQPMDYAALGIKVEALEGDVREVKDSILGLDAKIDKAISSLSHEVRAAISALSSQFAERNRTPWGVLFSGAAVIIAALGVVGGQALAPIQSDLKSMKEQIVPREEITIRSEANNRRLIALEDLAKTLGNRRYDEMQGELRELRNELRDIKKAR